MSSYQFINETRISALPPCITCMQYHGGVQSRGGYNDACGDILSTVGDVQYHGGYLEYCGCSVLLGYHEYNGVILSTVGYTQYCRRYHDACRGYHEYHWGVQCCGGTQITKDLFPHGTEHPHGTHDIPHVHNNIPTVLSIPHGTQDKPMVLMISPTVLNTPTVL